MKASISLRSSRHIRQRFPLVYYRTQREKLFPFDSSCVFPVVIICFVLFCTCLQIGSTQPLLEEDEDDDQASIDNSYFNNYLAGTGRLANQYPHGFKYPENLIDEREQVVFYPVRPAVPSDRVQLAKRIIMLPRVGRRSISRK